MPTGQPVAAASAQAQAILAARLAARRLNGAGLGAATAAGLGQGGGGAAAAGQGAAPHVGAGYPQPAPTAAQGVGAAHAAPDQAAAAAPNSAADPTDPANRRTKGRPSQPTVASWLEAVCFERGTDKSNVLVGSPQSKFVHACLHARRQVVGPFHAGWNGETADAGFHLPGFVRFSLGSSKVGLRILLAGLGDVFGRFIRFAEF